MLKMDVEQLLDLQCDCAKVLQKKQSKIPVTSCAPEATFSIIKKTTQQIIPAGKKKIKKKGEAKLN